MKTYRAGSSARKSSSQAAGRLAHAHAISPRTLTFVLLLALCLQFLLGMLTNLYVQVPAAHPGSNAANYFVGVAQGVGWGLTQAALFLQLHVIVGLLLFLGSLWLLWRAIALRDRAWIIIATLGVLGIIGAGFNGASFMNYGHDFSSLIMSLAFLFSLVAYLVGLYLRAEQ